MTIQVQRTGFAGIPVTARERALLRFCGETPGDLDGNAPIPHHRHADGTTP
jgi:hypothetical protein